MLIGNDEKLDERWKLTQEIGLKNGPMGPEPKSTFYDISGTPIAPPGWVNEEVAIGKFSSN